MSRILKNSL